MSISRSATLIPQAVTDLVVSFATGLRRAGVSVSSSETIDAARALTQVDLSRRAEVRAALRSTLVKDDIHAVVLDRLLNSLLPRVRRQPEQSPQLAAGTGHSNVGEPAREGENELRDGLLEALRRDDRDALERSAQDAIERWGGITDTPRGERHHVQRVLRGIGLDGLLRELLRRAADRDEGERGLVLAEAGMQIEEFRRLISELVAERIAATGPVDARDGEDLERLDELPILMASPAELKALRHAVRPLAQRLATKMGRRRRRGRGTLDMRRTIRSSMSSGGIPVTPILHHRHPSKPDLVVLCDVSGSVAQFAPFTLSLLHAVHGEFTRVRSWVFIDGIVEITDLLHESNGMLDARALLSRRGLVEQDGRSDYARAMRSFLARWPDAITTTTTVLIVGDARSHDRASAATELAALRRLARHMYWFNPEAADQWDSGDSLASRYRDHVQGMYEVATLRQLGVAVEGIM
jgi:uncharacterized protein with von Willebrand factor type A (vWA) domain